ncbi:MAG TPA: hypothetical protein VFS76_03155 [Pyrinomonadaceae bacterium]|nr:hypothetical protein [Pyrinomonadaceae bacterium]
MELSHRLDLKIILTGGLLNKNCFALSGGSGVDSVNAMFYDVAFIGVDGIHGEHGLTSNSTELGVVNRAMMQQSRKTVVVADHTKFGKVCKMLIAPVAKADLIVTDKNAPRLFSRDFVKIVRV